MERWNEEELSEHARVLDPAEWVDAYGDHLFRMAMRTLHNADEAEEVVQETLLTGVKKISTYAGRGSQLAWLIRILRSKCFDFLRSKIRSRALLNDEMDPAKFAFDESGNWKANTFPDAKLWDSLDETEFWDVVERCINKLPSLTASVFLMRTVDSLGPKDIADELEISESNVSVRMHRARISLAKCVGANWMEQPLDGAKFVSSAPSKS